MDERLLRFDTTSTFVFADFETYNLCLNFSHNLPWQLAMMKVRGDTVLESFDAYIKWKTHLKISKEAAKVTKFDQAKFDARAVPPEEVYPVMKKWFEEADYILGHNFLGFDVYLMKEWFRSNGDDPEPLYKKILDTHCFAKAIKLNWPDKTPSQSFLEWQYPIYNHRARGLGTSLKATGEGYGIEHDYSRLHDALVDLGLNVKVWHKQKFMLNI